MSDEEVKQLERDIKAIKTALLGDLETGREGFIHEHTTLIKKVEALAETQKKHDEDITSLKSCKTKVIGVVTGASATISGAVAWAAHIIKGQG